MSPRKDESWPEKPESGTDGPPETGAQDGGNGNGDAAAETPAASGWAQGDTAAELEALRAENAELKDRALRTMAEMENLRRRTERDKADTAKYAISAFARDVLTAGDNLARAISAVPQGAADGDPALKALVEGVEVTERELQQVLERHGITKLDPAGERFDPNRHQAMLEMENRDVPVGTVVEVLQPGYLIEDRVLRPALVAVSKGGAKPEKAAAEPEAANENAPEPEPDAETPETDESGDGGEDGVGGKVDRSA